MWILIVGLVLLAIVAMIAGYIRNKRLQKKIDNGELDSLLAAVSKQIEYYDDEELDTFIGRAPEDYTPEEADKFRDVFYTMQDTDVAGWVRSLQLRGISLPDEIKDEVFLVVGERRIHP